MTMIWKATKTELLFAAAQIEAALRYAKEKNTAYGHDETLLRDIESYAAMLRRNAVGAPNQ